MREKEGARMEWGVESWGYGGGRKGLEGLEGAVIKLRRSLVASFYVESLIPFLVYILELGEDLMLYYYTTFTIDSVLATVQISVFMICAVCHSFGY
jgi:hypothetical protein